MGGHPEAQEAGFCQAQFGSPMPREDPVSKAVSTAWGAHFTSTTFFTLSTVFMGVQLLTTSIYRTACPLHLMSFLIPRH